MCAKECGNETFRLAAGGRALLDDVPGCCCCPSSRLGPLQDGQGGAAQGNLVHCRPYAIRPVVARSSEVARNSRTFTDAGRLIREEGRPTVIECRRSLLPSVYRHRLGKQARLGFDNGSSPSAKVSRFSPSRAQFRPSQDRPVKARSQSPRRQSH